MCADWSIHDKGDGNPHVHLLLTMRPFNPEDVYKRQGNSRCSNKFFAAICFIRNYQITDTLSRKGQRFTVRIANNSICLLYTSRCV